MNSSICRKISILSILISIFMALSSCVSVLTPKPTEQSATIPGITQTVVPTETKIPTVTLTPSKTNTPTETAVPVPEYNEGVATSIDKFTKLTKEQTAIVKASIEKDPQLPKPATSEVGYSPRNAGGILQVYMGCRYGSDCIVRASIREENPLGGPDLYIFIIEFRDTDGSDKVIELCINGVCPGVTEEQSEGVLEEMQVVKKGDFIYWIIITQFTGKSKDKVDPYAWSITNGANDDVKNDLEILQSGPKTFPDGLLDDPLVGSVGT
jgi:hypothetical protein